MCEALCLSGLASALTFSVRLQGDAGMPTLTLQSLGGAYPLCKLTPQSELPVDHRNNGVASIYAGFLSEDRSYFFLESSFPLCLISTYILMPIDFYYVLKERILMLMCKFLFYFMFK